MELLEDVKLSINVTWDDAATDRKLHEIIRNSIAYFETLLSGPADVNQPGMLRELFFDRCRYAWNEALDAFEANYQHLLTALVNDRRLEYAAAAETQQ